MPTRQNEPREKKKNGIELIRIWKDDDDIQKYGERCASRGCGATMSNFHICATTKSLDHTRAAAGSCTNLLLSHLQMSHKKFFPRVSEFYTYISHCESPDSLRQLLVDSCLLCFLRDARVIFALLLHQHIQRH